MPLDESFYIEHDGQLEQWYYDNTEKYAPNRKLTPLTLIPKISAFDKDTKQKYEPSFYTVSWFERAYDSTAGDYVETEITNITDGDTANYVKVGNNLLVKKNVSYTRSVTIRCEATYIDPRDSGVTYRVQDAVILSTNRDASVEFPTLNIAAPSSQSYNPLVDASSSFTFHAIANKGGQDVSESTYFVWYAVDDTVEVLADTMPWYVSGQNTQDLVVDAMYGEDIRVVLRAKDSETATALYPDKVHRTLHWRIPDVDTSVVSQNGSAVRSNTVTMAFGTVVNIRHSVLSDEMKKEHLYFNWKIRKNTTSTETDMGWGQQMEFAASELRNTIGNTSSLASTLVFPYVYLLGAYEKVTDDGVVVTDDDDTVFDRPVF
jgi:hypothetical protein